MLMFFFFSSRRRHTRFKCDWSSDVCSSDLVLEDRDLAHVEGAHGGRLCPPFEGGAAGPLLLVRPDGIARAVSGGPAPGRTRTRSEERRVGKECRSRWSPYH